MAKEYARRVLLMSDDLGGGTGIHLAGMLGHLDKEKWSTEIISRATAGSRFSPDVPIRCFLPDGRMRMYPLGQIRDYLRIRKAVVRSAPDIVHAYFFWSILFGRLLKLEGRIRILVENREDQGFSWGTHEYLWLRMTRRAPDRIVCVSDAVKRTVMERENIEESRITVIRNGVGDMLDGKPDASETRRSLGLDEGHLVVGMVANFNRSVKGVSVFLDAVPKILEAVPSARFLLLGGGEEEASLRAKARSLGIERYAIFAGFRSDIHRYYAVMDVSVLTSFSEGLSITLLESMRCGLPVIATRVGGNPELVRDGITGYLVPPGDVSSFAEKTVRLLQDKKMRSQMGKEGRLRSIREYRLEDVTYRYLALYEELIDMRTPYGP